jgi:plasmid replication initiation protein
MPSKQQEFDLAVQHNKVVAGRYEMTVIQKRIFLLVLKQITAKDENFKNYTVRVKDLIDLGGSENLYQRLRKEVEGLMGKPIGIEKKNGGWKLFTLIGYAEYFPKEGRLDIQIHPEMKDYFLQLKRDFTPIPIQEIMKCSSVYGQRFYELLYRFRDTGWWTVTVDKLRGILKLEDKYANFTHFRKYVLKQAQRDLADTNLSFTWNEIKAESSRRIERLNFQIDVQIENLELPFPDDYNIRQRLKNQFSLEEWQITQVVEFLAMHSEKQKRVSQFLYDIQLKEANGEIKTLPAYTWRVLQSELDLQADRK